jgi:hypothetical protein
VVLEGALGGVGGRPGWCWRAPWVVLEGALGGSECTLGGSEGTRMPLESICVIKGESSILDALYSAYSAW